MSPLVRQLILGLGAALLVGGWGTIRYADARQQTISIGGARLEMWHDAAIQYYDLWFATRTIYAGGVLVMALGAGLIGFAIPRPRDRSTDLRAAG